MVSPVVFRKVNKDKVKKIVSNASRPESRIRNDMQSGLFGSSITTRSWNESHEANVLTPIVSEIGTIDFFLSAKTSNGLQDTNTQTLSVPNDSIIGASKPTKKRGKTKGHKLAKTLEQGQRFEVIFPEHVNRPVGKYSTMFTTELGVLVRQISLLQAVSWGAVSREKKESIMDRLRRNSITQMELAMTELYEISHQRSDGTWVHENAGIFHESLKEHKSKAESEGTNLTDEQLSMLTFGRKSGYLCGLGRGPKPTSSTTGKRTRSKLEREAYEADKRAELAERSTREARQETAALAEKLKRIEDQQDDFSAKLKEEMNMQFAFFRQQLMGSSLC